MKRILTRTLAVFMVLAMTFALVACSGGAEVSGDVSAEPEAPEAEAPADAPAEAPADAAPAEGALSLDTIKIGFIFNGEESDQGYAYAHIQGVKKMQTALGLRDDQIICKYNIGENSACYTTCVELADAGCNMIFCNSFGHEDYVLEAAAEYPDIQFLNACGYQAAESGLPNMHNFFGKMYQSHFLSGIIAGKTTKSNQIGFVAAMPYAEIICHFTSFYLGALSVNPDAKLNVLYTNTWKDATLEAQAAQSLIDLGCDVIGMHCDTPASQTTAQTNGVFGVGYNTDMTKMAPTGCVASDVWDWSVAYIYAVQSILAGEQIPSDWCGDISNGMVNPIINEALVPQEVIDYVEAAKAKLAAGELFVFAGPIYGADGSVVVAEGEVYHESAVACAPAWDHIIQGVTIVE